MNTVVIGSSREQKLPSLVLEYTIKKHASIPVRIIHTYDKKFPSPKKPENQSRTGFSFARFAIPALMNYEGVAAYLECDQIVFRDIKELFSIPFNNATVLRPQNQPSVLLLDCNHLRWDVESIIKGLDDGQFTYKNLMENTCIVSPAFVSKTIPNQWNSLEAYKPGETRLLHYTNMAGQPWRLWGHPMRELWLRELLEAVIKGFIPFEVVREEVQRKSIVPQVMDWLKRNLPNASTNRRP